MNNDSIINNYRIGVIIIIVIIVLLIVWFLYKIFYESIEGFQGGSRGSRGSSGSINSRSGNVQRGTGLNSSNRSGIPNMPNLQNRLNGLNGPNEMSIMPVTQQNRPLFGQDRNKNLPGVDERKRSIEKNQRLLNEKVNSIVNMREKPERSFIPEPLNANGSDAYIPGKLADCISQVDRYKNLFSTLRHEKQDAINERNQYQRTIVDQDARINTLQNQNNSISGMYNDSEQLLQSCNIRLNNAEEEVMDFGNKYATVEQEIDGYKTKFMTVEDRLSDNIGKYNQLLLNYGQRNSDLYSSEERELTQRINYQNCYNKLTALEQKIGNNVTNYKQSLDDLRIQNSSLASLNSEYANQIYGMEEEINDLKSSFIILSENNNSCQENNQTLIEDVDYLEENQINQPNIIRQPIPTVQIVPTPPLPLTSRGGIKIRASLYGNNCPTSTVNPDVTNRIGSICNGRKACWIPINDNTFGQMYRDTSCTNRAFTVDWECGGNINTSTSIDGNTVRLSCQ